MQHQSNGGTTGFNALYDAKTFEEAIQGLVHDDGRDKIRIQNMYKYPANRKQALMHKKANQFGYNSKTTKDNKPALVCPCCQLPINTVRIKIKYGTTPTRDNVAAGKNIFLLNSGSAMFFTFIKMTVAYLLLRFILTDCYNLISNTTGDSCNQSDNSANCSSNIMSRLSTYNKGNIRDQPMVFIVDVLNLVTIVASMVFFMFYRRYQHEVYTIADISNHSQIDYSIFIENIPIFLPTEDSRNRQSIGLECKYEHELKDLLEQQINEWITQVKNEEGKSNKLNQQLYKLLQQNPTIQTSPKVMSVSLCFDLTQMEKLNAMRQELMKLHKQNEDKGVKDDQKSLFYIPNQIECLNQEYINLSKKFAADNSVAFNLSHFVGKAYVTFEYEHFREYFLEYLRNIQSLTMNGKPLKISSAAQPSDVYWFNMKISYNARRNSIIESYLVMFLSLGLSFVLLFQIQLYKSTIASKKNELHTSRQIFFSYFYTIIMTTLTIAINFILALVIQRLTDLQKHKTKTDYIFSLMVKTVLAQFMNTAVIYYIISLGDQHDLPLSDNGLVMNVTSLVAVSGVIQIVLNALQPGTIFRNIMNWFNYRQKQSVSLFQVQLNNVLQDPQFNFSNQYAYYIINVYIVSFYSYITPYIGIILAIIFCVQYWVDKYNLFQRFSCPIDFDFKLSRFTLKAFECSIFIFSLGNLLFSIDIHATKQESDYHIINWVSFGLSTAYCVAIIVLPKKWFQGLDQDDYQKTPYSQCLKRNAFNKVYWLCNPATTFALEEDLNHKGKYISYGGTQEFATSNDFDYIVEAERNGQYKIETYTSEEAKNIANTLNVVIGNELGGLILQKNEGESIFGKLNSFSK